MDQIPAFQFSVEPETLMALSRLYTFPEQLPLVRDVARVFAPTGPVPACSYLTGLQNRYVSLFINRLPEVPCIPCGSWYLEGTLMGPSTIELAKLYQAYGFETSEIPDHIAVELEFLSILTALVHRSSDSENNARLTADLKFVSGHLAAWTPEFLERVVSWDEKGFYGALARVCQSFF